MHSKTNIPAVLALGTFLISGCQSIGFMTSSPSARCELAPLSGSQARGSVTFTQKENGVLVEADLMGLSPGKHGIHIHAHGDCSMQGEAAGPHFEPGNATHGSAAMATSHEGDLGNIVADAKGKARLSILDPWLMLTGDRGILGRSVILHAGEDDLVSQPGGNAGARIACGPIRAL